MYVEDASIVASVEITRGVSEVGVADGCSLMGTTVGAVDMASEEANT